MGVLKVNVGDAVTPDWRGIGCNRTPPETLAYNGTTGYDGSSQDFVVPSGVTTITVELWGAQGGRSGESIIGGGLGGYLKTDLVVTPWETLTFQVGGSLAPAAPGSGTGGYNGGGIGGHGGGGGGGATTVLRGTTVLAVAGGGGGAGDADAGDSTGAGGAGGSLTGAAGSAGGSVSGATAGGGGTQLAGGSAGTPTSTNGTAGSFGQGGNGGRDDSLGDYGAGGGGGGYYGGGGGGRGSNGHIFVGELRPDEGAGGGGGGSSYSSGTIITNTQGVRSDHGEATVTWTAPDGRLKLWTGTEWVVEECADSVGPRHPLKVWDGTAWQVVACMVGDPYLYDTDEYDTAEYS